MTRSVVADGQHLAPLDALSGISISTTETIPASCANATDFFNTLLDVCSQRTHSAPPYTPPIDKPPGDPDRVPDEEPFPDPEPDEPANPFVRTATHCPTWGLLCRGVRLQPGD